MNIIRSGDEYGCDHSAVTLECFDYPGDTAKIESLHVARNARGNDLGSRTVGALLDRLQADGYAEVHAKVQLTEDYDFDGEDTHQDALETDPTARTLATHGFHLDRITEGAPGCNNGDAVDVVIAHRHL